MKKLSQITFTLVLFALAGCASTPSTVTSAAREITAKSVIVSAVQFQIIGNHSAEQFFERIEAYVKQAVEKKSTLVVFPELLTDDTLPSKTTLTEAELARQTAKNLTPKYFEKVIALSAQYKIAILAGTSPRFVGKKIFNTALLAFPDGRTIYQDKIFITGWEVDQGWSNGDTLQVFEAPWGRTVILTCYDSEFPLISQKLADLKPEWILIPSMTTSNAGYNRVRWSSQARAVEHHAFIVLTGTVGSPAPNYMHHGQAAFIEPWDKTFFGLINEGPKNAPALVTGVFDIEALRANRIKTRYYPVKTQATRQITVKALK